MKRQISVLTCIALCISFCLPAAANTDSLAEKVLLSVRTRIPDTTEYTDFSSTVTIENNRTVYHFDWSIHNDNGFKGMYVSALESGIITSFSLSDGKTSTDTPSGFDRISINEAQKRTKALLKKLNPDIADKLTLKPTSEVEQFDAKNHTFTITHTESGIPVYGDRGYVTVDINATKITGFNMTYTDGLAYPSPIKIIDLATAKSTFAEEIGLDLYYRVWQDNQKKTVKIFPVYSPKKDNIYINANTGAPEKIIPFSESFYTKNESMSDSLAGSGGASPNLTPAELKEIQNLKKLLSRTDAEALVRNIPQLNISAEYELEEFTTRKLSFTEELYGHNLVFCRADESRKSFIYIDINAQTGELLSYSNFTPNSTESAVDGIDPGQLADEIIKTLAPNKYAEYKLRPDAGDTHFKVYDRYVNGIRVDGNTVSIEIGLSGRLASYRISYTNASFPMYADILSNKKASNRLFDTAGYSLMYIPQKSNDSLKYPDKAVLIYDLSDYTICLDPYSGKRINTDGTIYIPENTNAEYTDISGHYAEDKIKALRRFGIGFDTAEFLPDSACLQRDFITLLVCAFGTKNSILIASGADRKDYYAYAESLGIIKPEEVAPDATLSRIQAVKFICRALKIEKYAQIEKIYNCPFIDVSTDKGYATLLWGMGVVNGTSKNTFSPNEDLSRGQAAIIIYNAMSNK